MLCTGKIYYDLAAKQEADKRDDVAIVRLEQLYPMPVNHLEKIFKRYSNAEVVWVQEESSNMGAWQYMNSFSALGKSMRLVSRRSSASPATGFKKVHEKKQAEIVEAAFNE